LTSALRIDPQHSGARKAYADFLARTGKPNTDDSFLGSGEDRNKSKDNRDQP
jgi:hypothetical protein